MPHSNGGLNGEKNHYCNHFNEQYNLTTELPKKETEAIAEMVDKKMQQFAEKTHVVKTGRVAVWAALDFAGELYKLRKEYEKLLAAAKE